jgi:hypothetical protein
MITFKQFIAEGGNVQIGDVSAERIDLSKINRDSIIVKVNRTLQMVNLQFKKKFGLPIWNKELFASKKFLSGSAFHFFNRSISTPEFKQYKNTVGDIDTQVDKAQEKNIETFLTSIIGETIGYVTFVGYKKSAGQFITLWAFSQPKINIQIDMELVDFANGSPTEWSQFSHSSDWADMKEGIKGVFQKYLMRAFTTKTLRDIIVLKGVKETLTKIKSTDLAFSVQHGLRLKLEPVVENGVQKHIDGLQVYREIPSKGASYINDLKVMFEILFGSKPSSSDIDLFGSFVGGLEIAKKHFNKPELKNVIIGFAHTLWGPGGQGLYRGNPELDQREKMAAFMKMIDVFGVGYNREEIDAMRTSYYKNYKS